MKNFPQLGIQIADILLPNAEIDRQKWAVIAVDQYTSQPEYWQQVADLIGDAPSTFHLTLPEVWLGKPEEAERVVGAQQRMASYLEQGLFDTHQGMVYVERSIDGKTRRGLVLALDLEQYDYHKGAKTLIRATEGTILDRLPPRMKIRRGAALELPHILVLIDDPDDQVIGFARRNIGRMTELYDFELMQNSGRLAGYLIDDPAVEEQIIKGLEKLAAPDEMRRKYGIHPDKDGVLLFAVGDGNHSLATAKAVWEELKPRVGMDHPARYALVEIENVHAEGLQFEPIHRVLFGLKRDILGEMAQVFRKHFSLRLNLTPEEMIASVKRQSGDQQTIGVVSPQGIGVIEIKEPAFNLPVGTLQLFLDGFLKDGGAESIDYVHGTEPVLELGRQPGQIGFFLPAMDKSDLFKTVLLDGALPRKTFSMGEAEEKRFYMEARRIA